MFLFPPLQVRASPCATSCSVCATNPPQNVWRRHASTTACRRSGAAAPHPPAAGPAGPPNHGFPLSPARRARRRREEAPTWRSSYKTRQFRAGEKRKHLRLVQTHTTLFKSFHMYQAEAARRWSDRRIRCVRPRTFRLTIRLCRIDLF